MKGKLRTWGLLLAFIVGGFFPQISQLSPVLPVNIVFMLGITFLGLKVPRLKPQKRHFLLVLWNVLLGVIPWGILYLCGAPILAETAFFCGIAPMATAAPVIVNLLRGNVEFTVTGQVLSNFAIAAALPILMPLIVGQVDSSLFFDVAGSVAATLALPALLAFVIRRAYPRARLWAPKLRDWSLLAWIFSLTIIAATASQKIREIGFSWQEMLPVALVSCAVCVAGFVIGYRIGYPKLKRECSQCLGQKNTIITIYLAMTYATDSPLIFLGPVFYSVFHNVCNAVQMALANREYQARMRCLEDEMRAR